MERSTPLKGISLLFVGLLFIVPALSELLPNSSQLDHRGERHGAVYEFSKQIDGVYGGNAFSIAKQRLKHTDGLLIEEVN